MRGRIWHNEGYSVKIISWYYEKLAYVYSVDNLTDAWRTVATGGGAVEPHPVSVLVTILDPRVK